MRAIATAILLSVLLQACGSKGALIMPQKQKADKQQQSNNNKQD
ncbi:MAG TPA: lipoprotein [Burkholderiales bacterium]|nr:lipoprotein [Burkholderiales bacterium]